MKKLGKLALCIALCLSVGWIGSVFTQVSVETWYPTLHQPVGTPPQAAFAPVWIFLYVMMGVSLWWISNTDAPKQAYALFIVQLMLNMFWSFLFFGMHSIFLGLVDLLLLDVVLGATLIAFWDFSKTAALLLIPYLLWVLYATYLNFGLFLLNRYS